METGLLVTLISQAPLAAGGFILAWLFYKGKIHTDAEFLRTVRERDEYKKALETERLAVNETAQAGAVTNQLLSAVVTLAANRQGVAVPAHELPTKELNLP